MIKIEKKLSIEFNNGHEMTISRQEESCEPEYRINNDVGVESDELIEMAHAILEFVEGSKPSTNELIQNNKKLVDGFLYQNKKKMEDILLYRNGSLYNEDGSHCANIDEYQIDNLELYSSFQAGTIRLLRDQIDEMTKEKEIEHMQRNHRFFDMNEQITRLQVQNKRLEQELKEKTLQAIENKKAEKLGFLIEALSVILSSSDIEITTGKMTHEKNVPNMIYQIMEQRIQFTEAIVSGFIHAKYVE
jgi:hypothetical protein